MKKSTFTHRKSIPIITLMALVVFFLPVGFGVHTNNETQETLYSISSSVADAQTQEAHTGTTPEANEQAQTGAEADINWFSKLVGNIIVSIAAAFAWVGGTVLDLSISTVVTGMGDLINRQGVGIAIDTTWSVIRDFCNLAFIFGFIYIGIMSIIDYDSGKVKSTLAHIIIGALLINFSLFITQAVIEFSNYLAYQVYVAMTGNGSASISGALFNELRAGTIYAPNGASPQEFAIATAGIWYYIMVALVLFVAAFVFMTAAILLIIRFVALVFIMIASPILFAATVFPKTEGMAKDLWHKLFSYAFFAPLYLFLLFISIQIIRAFNTSLGSADFARALQSGQSGASMGVIVGFLVAIFFLIQSVLISQKLGMAGASMAIGTGAALTAGTAAYVGRNTAGRIGHSVASGNNRVSRFVNRKASDPNSSRVSRWAANQTLRGSAKVGDATFDARNSKVVSGAIAGVGSITGVSANINSGAVILDSARKGGYSTVVKENAEKDKKFAQSLGYDEQRYKEVEEAGKASIKTQEAELKKLEEDRETQTEAHRMDQEMNIKEREKADTKVEAANKVAEKAMEAETEANAKATEAETKLREADEKVKAEADALSKTPDLIKDTSKLDTAKRELATAQAADTLAKTNLTTAQAASTAATTTLNTEKATLQVIQDKITAKKTEIELIEKAYDADILPRKATLVQTKANLNTELNGGVMKDIKGNNMKDASGNDVEVQGIKRERQVAYADYVASSTIGRVLYNKTDMERTAKAIKDSAGKAPDQLAGVSAELKRLQDQIKANAAKP